jgi:hypothetical protein
MRTYLISCIVAAVIAVGAVFALSAVQENVDVAYKTIGVRL